MPKRNRLRGAFLLPLWIAAAAAAAAARGSVSVTFSDKDATPTATTAAPGGTFGFGVFLNESATADDVSGLDYRIQVSANGVASNGIGYFTLVSRASTSVLTPYLPDSDSRVAPVTLSPTNGTTDLGGDRNGNPDLSGPASNNVADYTLRLSNGTPLGSYTISFLGVGSFVLPTYSGGAPNYATTTVASDNTFTVTVASPEPTTAVTLFASAGGLFALVRPPRRRNERARVQLASSK